MLLVTAIIVEIVPYEIVWGGRLKTESDMYTFEIISILTNLFLISILLIKGRLLKFQLNKKVVNGILWFFFAVFILNTVGNILAHTIFEKSFSIVTLLLATLLGNILLKKNS
jgi:hypothetical protein